MSDIDKPQEQDHWDSLPPTMMNFTFKFSSPGVVEVPSSANKYKMVVGWISDQNENIVMFVPGPYRGGLRWPFLRLMLGRTPIDIDFKDAAHGEDWTRVFEEEPGSS